MSGTGTPDLAWTRKADYRTGESHPRTIRPIPAESLGVWRNSIRELRAKRLPRSQQHSLFEAALALDRQATQTSRDVFARLKQPLRWALWKLSSD